jgi:TolB protein
LIKTVSLNHLGVAILAIAAAELLAVVGLVVLYTQPAEANYPGKPGKIAYTVFDEKGDKDIYTIRTDGRGKLQLTSNHRWEFQPAYSPNGNRIAYVATDGNDWEIYTKKADGGGRRQITDNSTFERYPHYSPSGKRIAFSSWDGHDSEIYTIKAGGGDKRKVTDNSTGDYDPAYSPSGKRIVFEGLKKGASRPPIGSPSSEIYTNKASGGDRRQLTHNSTRDLHPDYGPGGKRIAYTHDVPGGDQEIYTMKTDGSGKFNVTDHTPADDHYPSYSPSGNRIAYVTNDRHDSEIYTIKPDGSGNHQVTNNPVYEDEPYWGSQ